MAIFFLTKLPKIILNNSSKVKISSISINNYNTISELIHTVDNLLLILQTYLFNELVMIIRIKTIYNLNKILSRLV